MRYLLIRPKFLSVLAKLEPLGLEYICGVLSLINKDYEIYDEFNYPLFLRFYRFKKKIKQFLPDVIGFTANANTVDRIIYYAEKIKKINPKILVIIGGPQAELNYTEFFTDSVDYIFHDSGLDTFKKAAECDFNYEYIKTLSGICYKENGEWVTNQKSNPISEFITLPDRTAFYTSLKKNYIFCKGKYALVKASFSCPFQCNFCYCCKMNNGQYTERSIESVIDEIEQIKHDKIWFVDDDFLLNRQRVIEFIDMIKVKKIKKEFMVYSRADFIVRNEDLLPELYNAGFRDILVGLEACNDELLNDYDKATDGDVNTRAVLLLTNNKLICNGLFIVDYRFSKEDFKKLYNYIKKTGLIWTVFGIFTPIKGSDFYNEYKHKLTNYKSGKLDFIHLVLKPEKMTTFMFYTRFYILYIKLYSRLLISLIKREGNT